MEAQIIRAGERPLATKLAWGGLTVALAMLAFTWFGGPEMLQPIFGGTAILWAFMWLTVPLVPVGGRLFTTWAGAAARKAEQKEILYLQRQSAIVIAACVVFATVWAIFTHNFYTKAYVNLITLGVGTNYVMSKQKLKTNPSTKQASLVTTITLLIIALVAGFGIVVNVYMAIVGDGYQSGSFGWLFDLMPELAVRSIVPPCYDFLSLCIVGFILAGRVKARIWDWERVRVAAKITAGGVGWLISLILLGGYIGGWLANIYLAGHGGLPSQLRQLLAITVVTRAPAYFIGGFGAAVISGLGPKVGSQIRKLLPRGRRRHTSK